MLTILIGIVGYSAYERFSTRANVDQVVTFESYGDDAVAIGLTDDRPGFVLLSRLPPSEVSIDAQLASSWLTGTYTILNINTPNRHIRIRLRSPLAILVDEDGAVVPVEVTWSHTDFAGLVHAADCEAGCEEHLHRCGQPLDDIASALANWPVDRVPLAIREFIRRSGG
ncbi:MAG: hypothetical protein HZB38_17245 [Planctomycetes bacterium]|nr:hypothetical protein [Planctomycetota bacterium]